jgi:ParB-like chromosome segregation protein Spo0J
VLTPSSSAKARRRALLREPLTFHPSADMFPLMEGEEFDALVADINANGQHARIVLKDGMILDGRNRYRACLAAGIEPSFACRAYSDQITNTVAYVISANLHRRHLTQEQKRELIAKLLKAQPEKSDRSIAATAKASPTTVGTVRAEIEAAGEVSKLDTRIDAKGVKQPAKKKRSAEQEEADKAECIRLWQKVQQAEKEAAGDVSRPAPIKIEPSRMMKRQQALQVIDWLLDPEILALAIKIAVEGERHHRLADVCDAVSRLYADLMKVGR